MIQEINLSDIEVNRTTPVPQHVIEAMAKDIEANGLKQPLIIDHWGMLIDGLTRLRALEHLGRRKVSVEVANTLQEAVNLLKALRFDPKNLSVRRRRDFGESLDNLIRDHVKTKLRGRRKPKLERPPATRELVGEVLGYPWNQIRRVFRWLEQDPTDPYRQQLIEDLDAGRVTVNQISEDLVQMKLPAFPLVVRPIPMGKLRVAGGDIITVKDQRHLLKELNRQLSAAVKGAAKLALPINIPVEELNGYITQLAQSRAALSVFIKSLRNEATTK